MPATATSGYLVQQDSSVSAPGDTVDVEIWVTIDESTGCSGGAIEILYGATCADAIAYTPSGAWNMNTCNSLTSGREYITLMTTPPTSGDVLVGTLTFECQGAGDCETSLTFGDNSKLADGSQNQIDVQWIDGTFTCGEPVESECLGTCCNDSECTDPFAENVPCKGCIEAGKYWHPNKDTACFNDVENPPDLCLTSCPECCDGVDNADTDTDVDYPADKQCPCGLSPSEDMGGPPIPELPTLALAGIGILGAILLARKRE